MEVCAVCFNAVDNNILVSSSEGVKIFNNCLASLHTAISENSKKDLPYGCENQLPFCKMCFDSAVQVTQISEQLAVLQKQLSDFTTEFSISVLHRRKLANKTAHQDEPNTNAVGDAECESNNRKIIEIDISGMPLESFPLYHSNSENSEDQSDDNFDNSTVDESSQDILFETTNQLTNLKGEYIEEIGYSGEGSYLADPVGIESEDLFIDSDENKEDNSIIFPEVCEEESISELQYTEDPHNIASADGGIEENENHATRVRKTKTTYKTENKSRRRSTKHGKIQVTTSELLKSVQNPTVILKRVQPDKIAVSNITLPRRGPASKLVKNKKIVLTLPTSITKKVKNCGRSLRKSQQQRNVNVVSTNDGFYRCGVCSKIFKQKAHCREHIRMHTGERPYKCPFCPKAFKRSAHLSAHKKLHTGERPYKCVYCPKAFITPSQRRVHHLSHTGETPYECDLCHKKFNDYSTIEKHTKFCKQQMDGSE